MHNQNVGGMLLKMLQETPKTSSALIFFNQQKKIFINCIAIFQKEAGTMVHMGEHECSKCLKSSKRRARDRYLASLFASDADISREGLLQIYSL